MYNNITDFINYSLAIQGVKSERVGG